MSKITITFKRNPKTGQNDLVIQHESPSDVLSHEHERDHKNAVTSLLGDGGLEDPRLTVKRSSATTAQDAKTLVGVKNSEPIPQKG